MTTIDWIIIAAYMLLSLLIGLYYSKNAGKNTSEFFLGGRNLPWFVAGISMVATTFAADTPLAVNELVYQKGIAGNWLWWSFLFGGMLTTFFFARLWRRAEVLTEVELVELRYGGKPAAFLRGFRAMYLGLFINTLILGWVNVAMVTILQIFFGLDTSEALLYTAGAMLITAIYSSVSGLMGVAITDMVQFLIAMTGCIILAILVLGSEKIGGIDGLKTKLDAMGRTESLSFLPEINSGADLAGKLSLSLGAFLAFVGIQWWASWYPGAEPGGGGYVAQRMMSAKNEKHAVYATLFFQIAHYALRPWPWIIVGLCTIVLYPGLDATHAREGYVMAMNDFLPAGLKGLLLVAFLAAYMSTIATQLNWGASYIVNDFYKRFMRRPDTFESDEIAEKNYVRLSRILTIALMGLSMAVTPFISSISAVWEFIMSCGAGLGLVLILRWWWWRINAWSEIAGTIAPFIAFAALSFWINPMMGGKDPEVYKTSWWAVNNIPYFITVGFTVLTILLVTFLTSPEKPEKLAAFYNKVRPGGAWQPVRTALGVTGYRSKLLPLLVCWISSIVFTYSTLFFFGKLIFKEWAAAGWCGLAAGVSAVVLVIFVGRTRIMED
ncbi:MAG: Na+/proline symporter [Bacteroidetes bacterium]|nr:MAG: Na+/proline symporter [Bacteroidota bacterium]